MTKTKRLAMLTSLLLPTLCASHPLQAGVPEPALVIHGVAAPVGQAAWSGIHATVDSDGKRIIAIQLWTGAGSERSRRLMIVDVETGKSELFTPPDGPHGQGSFGTFLSSKNRFYNIIDKGSKSSFYEFDFKDKSWRFTGEVPSGFTHTFTESDDGTIYAGMMPSGKLVAYHPDTRTITVPGTLLQRNWAVYSELSTDTAGWVYAAITFKEANIIAWHPEKGFRSLLPDAQKRTVRRVKAYRAKNGKVYVNFDNKRTQWNELFDGKLTVVEKPDTEVVIERQGWGDWRVFPDGSRIDSISVPNKTATLVEKDGSQREITFDYDSTGGPIMSIETGPDGKIYGSSGIPLRFFRYDPADQSLHNWGLNNHGGHINDLTVSGDKLYGAIYSAGNLVEIDPAKPWIDGPLSKNTNPLELYHQPGGVDLVGRPFVILGHPDGRHILMGGNPSRADAGGGLLIYDKTDHQSQLLGPDQLVAHQGIASLAILEDGTVVGGTTTAQGTGGSKTGGGEPTLFLLDWKNRVVTLRLPIGRSFNVIADLLSPDGETVYAIASGPSSELLHFDPASGKIVDRIDLKPFGSLAGSQAARILSLGPDQKLYILFQHQIVSFDPATRELATVMESDKELSTGSAWLGDRLYFASGSDLCSWGPVAPQNHSSKEKLQSKK